MTVGCDATLGSGYILTAFAFGLAIVALAYSIGNISGCHVNPAVSLALWIQGDLSLKDFLCYMCSQVLGALAGAGILRAIFSLGDLKDKTGGLGTNGLASLHDSAAAGILVEAVLTFVFVLAILGVTSKKANHGSFGGLVIGLTLVLVHILGIGLTGTSVNPARSLGPALVLAVEGETGAIACVWVFVVGPMIGAIIAAILYGWLSSESEAPKKAAEE